MKNRRAVRAIQALSGLQSGSDERFEEIVQGLLAEAEASDVELKAMLRRAASDRS